MKNLLKYLVVASLAFFLILLFSRADSENEQEASALKEEEPEDAELIQKIDVTEMYLPLRNSEKRSAPVSHIMLHFSSNVTEKPDDPFQVSDLFQVFIDYGVSTHYLIDRDGEIYELVRPDRVAYHAGAGMLPNFPAYENKLNDRSIGIELMAIGTKVEMAEFMDEEDYDLLDASYIGYTDAQYDSLERLLDYLHQVYPGIKRDRDHVIGHDEYAPERKTDPGSLFDWGRIGY